jgi:F-type H+-transporting ATPase subunit c
MTVGVLRKKQHTTNTMTLPFFHVAMAAIGAALGIGILGSKAAEATGRNPGAATPILVLSIILAALIEGVFILSAFAVK